MKNLNAGGRRLQKQLGGVCSGLGNSLGVSKDYYCDPYVRQCWLESREGGTGDKKQHHQL
jgi:hypothetical protein